MADHSLRHFEHGIDVESELDAFNGCIGFRVRFWRQVGIHPEGDGGRPDPAEVQGRLEQVSGVSRVMMKDAKDGRLTFEIESLQGRHIRAELARSVVNSGWNLSELRAVGLSLEDIFLQLTTSEKKVEGDQK